MVGSMTVINSSSLNSAPFSCLPLALLLFLAMAVNAPKPIAKATVNTIILLLPRSHYTTQNTQQNSPISQRQLDYYVI